MLHILKCICIFTVMPVGIRFKGNQTVLSLIKSNKEQVS